LLSADRNEIAPVWDDVSHIRAVVVDKDGIPVPTADQIISFNVNGPGVIAAVDSGDIRSHEPFQANERRAFQGRCMALVKASSAGGTITLTASAAGLESGTVKLFTKPAK
jgi:beta-galactosidase